MNHIVSYEESFSGAWSWAKCTCKWRGKKRPGDARRTHQQLDRDAEQHIAQQG